MNTVTGEKVQPQQSILSSDPLLDDAEAHCRKGFGDFQLVLPLPCARLGDLSMGNTWWMKQDNHQRVTHYAFIPVLKLASGLSGNSL